MTATARLALMLAIASLGGTGTLRAQQPDSTPPAARPGDVGSIDSILTTLYAVISGPVGQPRHWDRFFSLVHPQARLIPTRCPANAPCTVRILSPKDYRQLADSFLVTTGFQERELARRVERYGSIAQAFSSYESFHKGETTPFARGINSIQLFWDGTRWWVMNIFWDSERPSNPLPADMQGQGQ
jgi:hypothetical protein